MSSLDKEKPALFNGLSGPNETPADEDRNRASDT